MACFNLVSIFFIYLIFLYDLLIMQFTTAQQPVYVYHFCLGNNYTTGSTFEANLNLLLSSVSIGNRNYNTTIGQGVDTVYGSVQCRTDVTLDVCQSCIEFATQDINKTDRCPISKQAIIYYEECMLRYSNQYYFNIIQDRPTVYMSNTSNVSNPEQFNPILGDLMRDLVKKATISSLSANFATGDSNLTNHTKVYGLVQCTVDISPSSCNRCLVGAIAELPNCCDAKQGGRVGKPSCYFRYELYPFLQYMNAPSPPLLSSPAPLISPPSETNTTTRKPKGNNPSILAISIIVPSIVALLCAIAFGFFSVRRKKTKTTGFDYETPSTESLQFNFSTVSAATDNFSEGNELGKGGFGSVYKGTLSDGQEIAVKRLSKYSGQGEEEFKNEVTLVAKLQHKNLVKLVGFSLAGEEKLLIYEFMPNASLDQFVFDPVKCTQMDWGRRYKIIGGVARGLHYLHEESRLRIIHRDLKASNILLDKDMNPKIADFGMARLFVLEQTQASTNRIVGTYGYMAPEYIMHGEFSVKSDVFSFGVLVLEILCGQRNSSFHKSDIDRDLLSYAWRNWNNESAIDILDPSLKGACSRSEVMRCIHAALLCVQENAADRPSMPTVVLMLNNSVTSHNLPSSPAFFTDSTRHIGAENWSVNGVSVTELYPR